MTGFIDWIVDVSAAGGLGEWLRRRPVRAAAQRLNDVDLERRIEVRAYRLWESEGRPSGRSAVHWRLAVEMEAAAATALPASSSLAEDISRLQFQSDLAEVQLLLDFISGRPDKVFGARTDPSSQVQLPATGPIGPTAAAEPITADELQQVATIRFPPTKGVEANAADATLLLRLRDKLNRFVYPASGLTIAFTLMTWAPFWSLSHSLDNDWARWKLANQAYPRLGSSRWKFRLSTIVLFPIALLITFMTVWTSDAVSDGQAKISRMQALSRQQATMMDSIAQIETAARSLAAAPGPFAPADVATEVVRFCDRPRAPLPATERKASDTEPRQLPTFDSPQQYQVCDKFRKLQIEADSAVTDLDQWWIGWKASPVVLGVCWLDKRLGGHPASCTDPASAARQTAAGPGRVGPDGWPVLTNQIAADGNVILSPPDFGLAVDTLADLTNIWLPVAYGFIGSIVAALRSVYTKISTSTLAPWDTRLMWTRVLLGIMAGACIGLFFSPSGTSVQGSTGLGSLSLAAIAFLAGYAVDGLFAMLDEIIRRLFRMDAEAPRPTR